MLGVQAVSIVGEAASVPPAVRLPPGPRIPKALQGALFWFSRRRLMQHMVRRYGDIFELNLPVFGRVVMIATPQLAKQVFTASPEVLGNIQPNLSRLFGSGSVFALDGDDHRQRRRLLTPAFMARASKTTRASLRK